MVSTDARVDFAEEADSFLLGDALVQGAGHGRVLIEVRADDNITGSSVVELDMLFVLPVGVGFVVHDEVDEGCSPIWIGDEYFLP